jgi:hypothetical protein
MCAAIRSRPAAARSSGFAEATRHKIDLALGSTLIKLLIKAQCRAKFVWELDLLGRMVHEETELGITELRLGLQN